MNDSLFGDVRTVGQYLPVAVVPWVNIHTMPLRPTCNSSSLPIGPELNKCSLASYVLISSDVNDIILAHDKEQ